MTTPQFATLVLIAMVFIVVNLFGLTFHFGLKQEVIPLRPGKRSGNKPKHPRPPAAIPHHKGPQPTLEPPPESPLPRAA